MAQQLENTCSDNRGGKRENAGAKPKGNVIYYRRVSPLHVVLLDNYLKQLKNGKL